MTAPLLNLSSGGAKWLAAIDPGRHAVLAIPGHGQPVPISADALLAASTSFREVAGPLAFQLSHHGLAPLTVSLPATPSRSCWPPRRCSTGGPPSGPPPACCSRGRRPSAPSGCLSAPGTSASPPSPVTATPAPSSRLPRCSLWPRSPPAGRGVLPRGSGSAQRRMSATKGVTRCSTTPASTTREVWVRLGAASSSMLSISGPSTTSSPPPWWAGAGPRTSGGPSKPATARQEGSREPRPRAWWWRGSRVEAEGTLRPGLSDAEDEVEDDEGSVDTSVHLEGTFMVRSALEAREEVVAWPSVKRDLEVPEGEACGDCPAAKRRHYTTDVALAIHGIKHSASIDSSKVVKRWCTVLGCRARVKGRSLADVKKGLVRHARLAHTREELYRCSDCPAMFRTVEARNAHDKKHKDISNKQCRQCLLFRKSSKAKCQCAV